MHHIKTAAVSGRHSDSRGGGGGTTSPPFPSTTGAQPRHVAFLTTRTAVRKNQENYGQTGSHAWTNQCLCRGGGGGATAGVGT